MGKGSQGYDRVPELLLWYSAHVFKKSVFTLVSIVCTSPTFFATHTISNSRTLMIATLTGSDTE